MMHANKTPVIFRLVCVRHGETDANKEFRIQGHIDVPLNELGKEQAKRVGIALSSYKWTRVYTSDLQRAQQTASIILQHSKAGELPLITVDKRIKERNFGRFENMLLVDVRAELKDKKTPWFEYTPEGAETMGEVQDRFVNFFKTLCQSVYDKNRHTQSSCNGDSVVTSNGATLDETADDAILQRDSSFLDANSIGVKDECETVLMVSHGAALRQLYCHLGNTLSCSFPGRVEEHPRNSAFSSFTVRYSPRSYALVCHEHNNANHLDGLSD